MRKLLISFLCASALIQPVMAAGPASLLTPTPVSAALTVGSWILTSDKKKVFEIEVEAQAATFEAAKSEAFRLAVEHAVGTLILSETEVHNDRMKRDEIITYASGFVERFEIKDRMNTSNSVRLKMKVWVSQSSIAQRLFNKSETAGDLEGPRVQAKVETYQQSRDSGDRVLDTVLRDYPQRAFDVMLEPAQVTLDAYRQPQVTVPFVLRWNEKYLKSFTETIERISKPGCGGMFSRCTAQNTVVVRVNAISSNPQGWFDDDITWNVMFKRMVLSHPMYRVTVFDQSSNLLTRQCYHARELDGLEYRARYFVDIGPGNVAINGQMAQRIRLQLPSDINIGNMGRVEVSVVTQAQC